MMVRIDMWRQLDDFFELLVRHLEINDFDKCKVSSQKCKVKGIKSRELSLSVKISQKGES